MAIFTCGFCGASAPANVQHICPPPTLSLIQEKREFRLGNHTFLGVELRQFRRIGTNNHEWEGEVTIAVVRGEGGGREEAVVAKATNPSKEAVQQSIHTALTQIGHAFIQAAEKG